MRKMFIGLTVAAFVLFVSTGLASQKLGSNGGGGTLPSGNCKAVSGAKVAGCP